jgi:hypothetical protein
MKNIEKLYDELEIELALYKLRNEKEITPGSPGFDAYTRGVFIGFETAFNIVKDALTKIEINK